VGRANGREAGAGGDRLAEQTRHRIELCLARLLPDGRFSHHDAADRGVADEKAGVHRDATLQAIEVLAEAPPVPGNARLEGLERHALDPREHPHEVRARLGDERRDREAAIPAHDGGHAVEGGRAQDRVPEDLRVVVRVDVDEPGRDDLPARVDAVACRLVHARLARDDASVANRDVGRSSRSSGAVDHRAAADHHIQHGSPPSRMNHSRSMPRLSRVD
jgi:hypothetical protein